jgi:hypothetical protein
MANLSAFTTALQGGGARANQFMVTLGGTGATGLTNNFHFLCRSAQVPALTIGEVAVPYRGRVIYLAGDRTYDAWTVTIMNDRNYSVRAFLENWMDDMSDIGGTTKANAISAASYYANATVQQLDRNNKPIRTYKLEGVWPTTLDAIDLSYDANDAIEEFGATFRFNWLTAGGGGQGEDEGQRNSMVISVGATYSSDF